MERAAGLQERPDALAEAEWTELADGEVPGAGTGTPWREERSGER